MTRATKTKTDQTQPENVDTEISTSETEILSPDYVPGSEANTAPEESTPDVPESQFDEDGYDKRIPAALRVPLLSDFCSQYLAVLDKIAEYNKAVVASKESEWSSAKILQKAHELGRPAKAEDADKEILAAIVEFEKAAATVAELRKTLINTTAGKLGIEMTAVADRNPELEGPLKENRKVAVEIGSTLNQLAKMTTDKNASVAVMEFLASNLLPAVGRDQMRSFSGEGSTSTPKYRVTVEVSKNGEVLFTEDGFTKAALALTKGTLYERGKAPKSEDLRAAWEAAGNNAETTVKPVVEFEDKGLNFKITKK